VKSRRPYLLRAMHEWITDSGCTPHIVVDANGEGVEVPRQYVRDGKIVLNLSWTATSQLRMTNDEVSFQGRFGGASMTVKLPIHSVLAIYARETGQGMIFSDDDAGPTPQGPEPAPDSPSGADSERRNSGAAKQRPRLKVVK
jgi:stringent starvation protein B